LVKVTFSPVRREDLHQVFVRTGQNVRADQFADFAGGLGPGIDGRLDAADVAGGEDGDQTAADGNGFDQGDIGGLDHGVAGLDAADVALGFNHAYRFLTHVCSLLLFNDY
jgi:hypothetical protein